MFHIYSNLTAFVDPIFGEGFGDYSFTMTPKISDVKFTDAAITILGLKLNQEWIVNAIIAVFRFFV